MIELPKKKVHIVGVDSDFQLFSVFLSHLIIKIALTASIHSYTPHLRVLSTNKIS